MTIKKGTPVRQIVAAPIVGIVGGFKIDEESGEPQVLVEWPEGEVTQARYFKQSEIEEITPEAPQ